MNIQEAITLLKDYLSKYSHDAFKFHPEFIKELSYLLKNDLNGKENDFFKGLITQLDSINSFKRMVYRVDKNEMLKGTGCDSSGAPYELISIHISSKQFNIRLLIKFSSTDCPNFLTAFNEKSGKKKSKNNYDGQISIAKRRFEQLNKEE